MTEDDGGTAIGDFIRSQRRLAQMSLRQLAGVAKVSNAYLSQIERGIYKPSAKVLNRLSQALQLSSEALYAKAGLLGEHPDAPDKPDVERSIRLDPNLTTEQKEALIGVYRGFGASENSPHPSAASA